MNTIQIILACTSLPITIAGAVLATTGHSLASTGERLQHHWAHPSMQLSRDPDEVIDMVKRGALLRARGRRRAAIGGVVAVLGMVLSLIVLLWVVESR